MFKYDTKKKILRNVHISQDVMRQINQRTDVAADPALR